MPKEYCKRCGITTGHKVIEKGKGGNMTLECEKYGNRKVLIQGFDADLM